MAFYGLQVNIGKKLITIILYNDFGHFAEILDQ